MKKRFHKLNKLIFIPLAILAVTLVYPWAAQAVILDEFDHESGDFSEYSASQDGGDLSVTNSAALGGTNYGIGVLTDDGTASYVYKTLSSASTTGVVRARFYIDPNSLVLSDGNQTSVLWLVNTPAVTNFAVLKLMNIGGQYALRGVIIDDNSVHQETVPYYITDGPHYVEIKVTRSTSVSSNDATYEAWVDGVAKTTLTGADLYNNFSDLRHIIFGQLSATVGVSGTFYIDELVVNNDGSEIGPLASPSPSPTPSPSITPSPSPSPSPTPTPSVSPSPTAAANSNNSSTSNNSVPIPDPNCHDQSPGNKVPWLYGAIPESSTKIRLYFTENETPVTKYILQFGTRSGNYQFGVQDIGVNERNQMSFLVQSLTPNTVYYFRVRAQNGCMPGQWSNELSAKTLTAGKTLTSIPVPSSPVPSAVVPPSSVFASPNPSLIPSPTPKVNQESASPPSVRQSWFRELVSKLTNWLRSLFN